MAKIFLSYARDDAARAGRVAKALEGAGHSAWWDHEIGAGSRFSKEIDSALRAAELVIVLWSKASIESAWVHDEAAAGRDTGRLVPVLIDRVEPPLGFRQYQAVELYGARRGARALAPLIDAIAKRAGARRGAPPPRRTTAPVFGWQIPAMIAGAALVMFGLWFLLLRPVDPPSHIVAVAAAESGEAGRSQELARSMGLDLSRYRAGPLGALTVLAGSDPNASKADYRVEVDVGGSGAGMLQADVVLMAPRGSEILWSASVEAASDRFVDLRQEAVAKLGDVLTCAVEVAPRSGKISREVLGLYLNGCGRMSDILVSEGDETARNIFRQITERAPDFAPGWAQLALIEGLALPGTPPVNRRALVTAARAHLAKAKQLDPTVPEIFAADANLLVNDQTKPGRALAILARGLTVRPDSAILHWMNSQFLGDVGRQNERIAAADHAMRLNPLSPVIRDAYISSLAYAGRAGAAFQQLREAEAIWPGSTVLRQVRYRLDLRYGDPNNALRLLKERGAGDLRPVPMDQAWNAFLHARVAPSPANIERALEAFRDRYRRDPADIPGYLQALGTFGRVDEAYEVVKPAESLDSMFVSTETLFRPHMQSIRADPRFIGLADRLGLLAYWRKSGVWPDFCAEPRLPYDCKAEAARTAKSSK